MGEDEENNPVTPWHQMNEEPRDCTIPSHIDSTDEGIL